MQYKWNPQCHKLMHVINNCEGHYNTIQSPDNIIQTVTFCDFICCLSY